MIAFVASFTVVLGDFRPTVVPPRSTVVDV